METAPAHNLALLQRARRQGCLTLFNNAPARPLSSDWMAALDVLIVNEVELTSTAQSLGLSAGTDAAEPAPLLRALSALSATTVVLTRGDQGVLAWHAGTLIHAPALAVPVQDTTGAGDTFCGVLAAGLVQGLDMAAALRRASLAASLACMKPGAQAAQPTLGQIQRAEIDNLPTATDT
jgi:ribokinase